jgi:dihydrofolate reductase
MIMRKIILGLAVSLDGFIEGPNGEYDWCFMDQDYGLSDFFKQIDTIFMGRKSYELSQNMEGENPWKGMTTYVFSNSLLEVKGENVKLITGDIEKQINDLRKQRGKDIWMFGGAELLTTFVNNGWIDEYWLSVHPIILGAGKPLFQNIASRKKLRLTDHKVYETGLVSLRYQPE